MSSARRTTGTSGLTILEVIISAAIVSMLALVILSANVPVSRTTNEAGVVFDMDRAASRFLTQLRREVRQSGYNVSTLLLSVSDGIDSGPSTLAFKMRTSFGDSEAANWGQQVQYALAASPLGGYPTPAPRYQLRRTQAGLTTVMLDHVQAFELTLIQEPGDAFDFDATLQVELVLARENPNWLGKSGVADPQRLLVRRYAESIEFLNKPQP